MTPLQMLSPRPQSLADAMAGVARGFQVRTPEDAIMARNILEGVARDSGDTRFDIQSSVQARMTEVLAANGFKDPHADISNTPDSVREKPAEQTLVMKVLKDRQKTPEEKARELRSLGTVLPASMAGMALTSAMSRRPFDSIDYTQDNAISASFNNLTIASEDVDPDRHLICAMPKADGTQTCFRGADLNSPFMTFSGMSLEPEIMLDDPRIELPAFKPQPFSFGL